MMLSQIFAKNGLLQGSAYFWKVDYAAAVRVSAALKWSPTRLFASVTDANDKSEKLLGTFEGENNKSPQTELTTKKKEKTGDGEKKKDNNRQFTLQGDYSHEKGTKKFKQVAGEDFTVLTDSETSAMRKEFAVKPQSHSQSSTRKSNFGENNGRPFQRSQDRSPRYDENRSGSYDHGNRKPQGQRFDDGPSRSFRNDFRSGPRNNGYDNRGRGEGRSQDRRSGSDDRRTRDRSGSGGYPRNRDNGQSYRNNRDNDKGGDGRSFRNNRDNDEGGDGRSFRNNRDNDEGGDGRSFRNNRDNDEGGDGRNNRDRPNHNNRRDFYNDGNRNDSESAPFQSVQDFASGKRVEVGLGPLSVAMTDDDDLDAEVRRSVQTNRKLLSKPSSPVSKQSNPSTKSSKAEFKIKSPSVMSPRGDLDDENYGPKIEISAADREFYYGKHPISVALRWVNPKILQSSRLFVMEGSEAQNGPEVKLAKTKGVMIEIASKMRMNEAMGQPPRPYQGLILELPTIEFTTIKKDTVVGGAPASSPPSADTAKETLMLALDEINDPMNLGAILRSAHFFGVFAILASEKNSAPLSSTVAKASAGAMFILAAERRLLGTKNLVAALQTHKQAGWRVIGTSASAQGQNVLDISKLEPHEKTILVMGSEEQGLRTLVKAECDVLVHIPRPERPPMTVSSVHAPQQPDLLALQADSEQEEDRVALNVSAAAAALLARLRK